MSCFSFWYKCSAFSYYKQNISPFCNIAVMCSPKSCFSTQPTSGFLKQYKNKVGTHLVINWHRNKLSSNKQNQSNRILLSALVEVAQNTIVLFFQTPSHMMQILGHLDTSMLVFTAVRLT